MTTKLCQWKYEHQFGEYISLQQIKSDRHMSIEYPAVGLITASIKDWNWTKVNTAELKTSSTTNLSVKSYQQQQQNQTTASVWFSNL